MNGAQCERRGLSCLLRASPRRPLPLTWMPVGWQAPPATENSEYVMMPREAISPLRAGSTTLLMVSHVSEVKVKGGTGWGVGTSTMPQVTHTWQEGKGREGSGRTG